MFAFYLPDIIVGFEETVYSVKESDGFVEVCVNITSPTSSYALPYPFNITLQTAPGTAGDDTLHTIALISDSLKSPPLHFHQVQLIMNHQKVPYYSLLRPVAGSVIECH